LLIRGLEELKNPLNEPQFLRNQLQSLKDLSPSYDEDVVDFYSDLCTKVELVGGKGSSLAKLAQLGKEDREVRKYTFLIRCKS
jgi:hypothetical protein